MRFEDILEKDSIEELKEYIVNLQDKNYEEDKEMLLKMELLVLSKDNCPGCMQLKSFLDNALKVEYKEIKLERDTELFMELKNKHNIMSTPAMIKGDKLLVGWNPSKVTEFLGI